MNRQTRSLGRRGTAGRRGLGPFAFALLMVSTSCDAWNAGPCGNRLPVEFFEVLMGRACEDCAETTVQSELTPNSSVTVAATPLLEVERCGVSHVFAYEDGVMLLLDSDYATRIASPELQKRLSPASLLLARVAGQEQAVSLLRRSDLRRFVPLLDVDSTEEVEHLLESLDPEPAALTRHPATIRGTIPAQAGGSGGPEGAHSERMLERAERHRPLIDELKRLAREGETETPEFQEILDQLERAD